MNIKRKSILLIATGFIFVAAAFLGVSGASASTGCFTDTNGHWAETFICWLKDNAISSGYPDGTYHPDSAITRAEMAVLLQKSVNLPPETGDIYITIPPNSWEEYSSTAASTTMNRSTTNTIVTFSSIGAKFIHAQVPFPSTLYGRSLIWRGVEICYSANATAYLGDVFLYQLRTTNSGDGATITSYLDTTNRTDQACRVYSLTTPVQILPQDYISILLSITVNDAVSGFHIGRATLIMSPSTSAPTPLPLGPETAIQPASEIPVELLPPANP